MSCTYTYKNKKYSKDRLLRKLATESLENKNQDQSIQWLKDKLGMTDSEIIIVKGLIDNKSLGRFTKDGRILLSSFASSYSDCKVAKSFMLPCISNEEKSME